MKRIYRLAGFLSCLLVFGGVLALRGWQESDSPDVLKADLELARAEMRLGKYEQARGISSRLLEIDPENIEAGLITAECLTKEGRLKEALDLYETMLASGRLAREQETTVYQCAGEILLHRGGVQRAEQYFREALKRDPYYPPAHNRLAFLLGLEGRRWESLPHLVELIKQDQFSAFHLLLLANPRQNIVVDDFAERARRYDPHYPIPRIPEAKTALERGDLDRAAEIIDELLAHDPQQVEVKVLEGTLCLLRNDREDFIRWSKSLNLRQESHPDCWLLRAQWSRQSGEADSAIRCYAEAFFRDPNCTEACQALVQLLPKDKENPEVIGYFEKRTKLLEHLESCSHLIHRNQTNVRLMEQVFACCDSLERYWEAWGWCRAAAAVDERLEWAKTQKNDIERHLVYDLPQTIIFRNINEWDYGKYPLPKWRSEAPAESGSESDRNGPSIAFREISADLGLDFRYESGHKGNPDDPKQGRMMYEVPGGGVAAIDYDLDLYPDLYFAQGAKSFDAPAGSPIIDRFFRNRSAERFDDVTSLAGLDEVSYSHGVSVGDFNSDGFPDLYVGNLGVNRLYANNGDGTFSDVSSGLPPLKGVWTTSTAIVDLNRDGHPDLYDANYLKADAYERLCDNDDGHKRACNPRIFTAERDRILLSNGDGTFADRSDALPPEADDARALGILAADYFGTGELQIFIANDMTANNFYVPDSAGSARGLALRDEALIRGLALDRRGRAQACMGVAFGDLDGNRTFDLFVTNFYGDYNTLYLQDQEMFSDLSHSSDLAALSYHMLGFGSQALDADLDGDLDLFVANGHIDDFTFDGLPYRMRPQLFVNQGAGRFSELSPKRAGPYFSSELLGRGVAKLDWNRDGKEDLLVSHLDTPAVLLSNESATGRRSLRLSFVGTKAPRDAVGTHIELTEGESVRVAQVSAGSGYLASNDNVVVLPVLRDGPVTLRVRWPDRSEVEFTDLQPGAHYRIVEGARGAYRLP